MDITIIDGDELKGLLAALGRKEISTLRLSPNGDGTVKVKIDEGMWSWNLGRRDR